MWESHWNFVIGLLCFFAVFFFGGGGGGWSGGGGVGPRVGSELRCGWELGWVLGREGYGHMGCGGLCEALRGGRGLLRN